MKKKPSSKKSSTKKNTRLQTIKEEDDSFDMNSSVDSKIIEDTMAEIMKTPSKLNSQDNLLDSPEGKKPKLKKKRTVKKKAKKAKTITFKDWEQQNT